jgi:hypothetical protein
MHNDDESEVRQAVHERLKNNVIEIGASHG